jgi:hypothetical protein
VTLIQVGYFSNLAALLDTPGDAFSSLNGKELVKAKVKFLSVMAGAFKSIGNNNHYLEYNVTDNPLRRDLLVRPIRPVDGIVTVPTGPGLGIELNEDTVARYTVAVEPPAQVISARP